MIRVYGYLGELSAALREDAARAAVVVGSRRSLDQLQVPEEKRQVLGLIQPAVDRMLALPAGQDAVVLASGDPLLFGVVRRMRQSGLAVEVIPAVSSLQAAFAKVALPWDDAQLISAHAGGVESTLRVAKVHPKVGVLTAPGRTIVEIAAGLKGCGKTFVVAEALGEENERVRVFSEDEALALTAEDVQSPHVVLILAHHPDDPAALGVSPEIQGDAAAAAPGEPTPGENTNPDGSDREPIIGHVFSTDLAAAHADAIDAALGIESKRYVGPSARGLAAAWTECDLIVSHLALGATVRLIAPMLDSKYTDPGVVVLDEGGRFAVPVVGGHVGGANDLARRIGTALGATPVVTTATDSLGIPALDQLGWAFHGDVAGVTGSIIAGRPVQVVKHRPWPLPPLPANVAEDVEVPMAQIVLTDKDFQPILDDATVPTVVLNPPSLVVGMGCNKGTSRDALRSLLFSTLENNGFSLASLTAIASADVKAGELGLIELAHELRVPYRTFPEEELAQFEVPNPSSVVAAEVGTSSVSEASVLAQGAELIVEKTKSTEATCAVGRIPVRGRLHVVGLGPGARDLLTPRAEQIIRRANVVVGYAPYVHQIRDLVAKEATILATKMGTEESRTAAAIAAAREGKDVAFVCGGDPAIYAMASPTLEMGTDGIDVEIVPGVTAELAVSAILGAPLGHDHATISLSDLHTDWDLIIKRVRAAAEGDLVTTFYNPRSRTRTHHLPDALAIMAEHRPPTTPVALVGNAARKNQRVKMSTLAQFQPEWVDMNTLVVVGSSTSKFVTTGGGEQLFVTPRDYHWMDGATSGEHKKNYRHADLPKADDTTYKGDGQ